jgi:undecaprenyl-diphosphatase
MLAALKPPKAVTLPLVLLVRIGDGYIWAFIAMYLWWAIPFKELETAVLQCCFAILVSLCIYAPVKVLTKRRRPFDRGLEVTPLVPPLDKYSFPSGHTMNNLAVSLTLALNLPSLIAPAILLPISFGILRVFFGVHFLSDIVGGALLGFTAFFLAAAVYPVLGF